MANLTIRYLAHSAFFITSSSGTRIITDPYTINASMTYAPITESADIVTVTHEHGDHNNTAAVKGNPQIIKNAGTYESKGISFKVVAAWHDTQKGAQRGPNRLISFVVDGVRICHLGDLGHRLTREQLNEIGKVDILFLPVGGFFTINASEATRVYSDIQARITIPMHYRTTKVDFPITGVDEFLKGKDNVKKLEGSILEIKPGGLPATPEIMVLLPSK
jgi:L-ascorbate metabolism protein UlaG (beta-lactamase superfamily)